ncbi:gliding motility-associated C-terminal domain-containing protein [Lutibacter sp.]|uniref:gliding motility-associated C-terminal domain-containing protein n=1 Tax=Lutibacter sp. TaxID=1925666 RepID=UPI002734BA2C|nr:gliding motility-associated C-terminal domain-containing protein [Lutibacter sp.]MDP3311821.1 gliding motility-associated C-terminal domain-containing protein [Lutibacter sp.]
MKKGEFSLFSIFLYLTCTFLISQSTFSQCLNPSPTGSASQIFCKSDNKKIADLVVSGGTILWFDAASGGNQLSTSTLLIDDKIYYADNVTSGGCSITRLAITVTIYGHLPTGVDIFVGKCAKDKPIVASLSATGSNIEWYSAQVGGVLYASSEPLVNGKTYWVQQTENGCTSSRFPTTVTIVDPPPPIVAPIQSFCGPPFPTVMNLHATGISILWYDSEDSLDSLDPSLPLENGKQYWASQNSFPCESTTRAATTVYIDSIPDAGLNSSYTVCEVNLATVNLFDLLGGTPDIDGIWSGPSILSGGYLGTYDPTVNIPGTYLYTVSSNLNICPDASASITITIIITLPPTINQTNQIFCEVDNPKVGDLSGSGSAIQWYDTATSNVPLNSNELLVHGQDYWATQTDATTGCESALRIVVTVTIIIIQPPTTTQTNQVFCEVDNPTVGNLTGTGTTIQWYDTATSTVPLSTTALLVHGQDYWATQTDPISGCISNSRLVVTVTIITIQPPTTTQTNQVFCEVDNPTVGNLTGTGTAIQWFDTATSTVQLSPNELLIHGQDYWATQTDGTTGCISKSRLVVMVSINTLPLPSTIQSNLAFCEIDYPTVNDLNTSGSSVQWYDSEALTAPLNASELLVHGKDYWSSFIDNSSGCSVLSKLVVTISINNVLPPTTLNSTQSFCEIIKPTISNLQASGNSIQWYDTATSTVPLGANELLVHNQDYWATQTNPTSNCESSTRLVVMVTLKTIAPPTTTISNQSFCADLNATIANLSINGNNILWYDSATSTIPLSTTALLVNGEDYWASQTESSSSCESSTRLVVMITLKTIAPPTTTISNQSFCANINATIANLSVSGNNILWYDSATSTIPLSTAVLLVNGEDYWATQTDTTSGCVSNSRLVVTATIITISPPTTIQTSQVFCKVDKPTVANLQVNENLIVWYDTSTSLTPLNSTELLTDGQDYWAAQSNVLGCTSFSRLKITALINDVEKVTINAVNQNYCSSDSPTIANLVATGNGVIWYATETSTTTLNTSELLVNGEDYWAVQTDATTGCKSSIRSKVNVSVTVINTPNLIASGNEFCKISKPTISDLNAKVTSVNGGTIIWYNSYPTGSILSLSELLVEGKTYYAIEKNSAGCTSTNPLEVTVTLEACDGYDIEIYDGFSPSGNGINDTFTILNLRTLYPDFRVEFYNRWGKMVYKSDASNPDWNGKFNGNGELAPAGIYYFIIYFNKENRKPIQHRLYLSR